MEKGKWYKGESSGCYIRFSYKQNLGIRTSVHGEIIMNGHYKEIDWWGNDEWIKYAEEHPVNIEEVRQYLPKDHPDLQDIVIENFQIY